mgnify:CR=1 FL=1
MADEQKKKKKKWHSILASPEFNNIKIGETLASESEGLVGRSITLNLMVLTNDPKKQSYNVVFRVTNLKGEEGISDLRKYYMNTSHTRRLVRKGIKKVEDSFLVQTKDDVKYQVKPLVILRFKTQKSIASAIRKTAKEHLTNLFKSIDSKDVFLSVISNKIQMDLKSLLRKIYPVNVCEIRVLEKL